MDSARCRAQSPQHVGRLMLRVMAQASKETNKQANTRATRRRSQIRVPRQRGGVESSARETREDRRGELQRWKKRSRAKSGSGSEAAKWLPLPGLGGRWSR